MSKNKYDHLFISGVTPEQQKGRKYATLGFLDGTTFPGCNEYQVFWMGPEPYGVYGNKQWGEIFHGPHEHKYPEVFMHLGTDPENPFDLGAEVEMHVGPEMEKHVITKSTIICLPANFAHGPWRVLKVRRPFLVVTVNQNGNHTEKARRDMVPEELRDQMLFLDQGYEDEGIEPRFDWPAAAGERGKYI